MQYIFSLSLFILMPDHFDSEQIFEYFEHIFKQKMDTYRITPNLLVIKS